MISDSNVCRQKNPAPPTNKTFLRNMLVSTLRDDRPLNFRRKLQDSASGQSDQSSSKHEDRFSKRDSETNPRYNDQPATRDGLNSGDSDRGDSLSSSHRRSRHSAKRPRESGCDSEEERKNGETKDSKKKVRKRHKRTAGKGDTDSVVKKKHKKSKKSKKHKSKKSGHSKKHKS